MSRGVYPYATATTKLPSSAQQEEFDMNSGLFQESVTS